jgi:predicted ATP-dependent endonuclease of OLD family
MALATSDIPEAREFRQACLNVLGIQLNVMTNEHGQQHLGVQVSRFSEISLSRMGAGVTSALNLLVSLSSSHQKLFLIEEPENDLHPTALKSLIELILEKSRNNQFIISTHSSVVLARLGTVPGSVVVHTRTDGMVPPQSSYDLIVSPAERIAVLQDLGYELADLELGEGWLIFEESSAERLAREFLIPWFAPRLLRLRTLAASGTSRLEPIMQDFRELFLFSHLEPMYKGRAWVVADGDPSGTQVIEQLRSTFSNWPPDRFLNFSQHSFEMYYPENFREEAAEVLAIEDKQERRVLKRKLLNSVLAWITEDEERARAALEVSAQEVIEKLRKIEKSLIGLGRIPISQ